MLVLRFQGARHSDTSRMGTNCALHNVQVAAQWKGWVLVQVVMVHVLVDLQPALVLLTIVNHPHALIHTCTHPTSPLHKHAPSFPHYLPPSLTCKQVLE